jgi:hypothetical protein
MAIRSNHYWRIRFEVNRDDGTVFTSYTPLYYLSYQECKRLVDSLNELNTVREVPVHHYADEFTIHPSG